MTTAIKSICSALVLIAALLANAAEQTATAGSESKVHRLALQISDNDPQKMNTVLNVAANVSRHYSEMGEEVEIQIVAFNQGLHMLRDDTSPIKPRMESFAQSMPNVSFMACGNTHTAMTKKEGKAPTLFEFAEMVPAGVVTLMEFDEQGWTIVRP